LNISVEKPISNITTLTKLAKENLLVFSHISAKKQVFMIQLTKLKNGDRPFIGLQRSDVQKVYLIQLDHKVVITLKLASQETFIHHNQVYSTTAEVRSSYLGTTITELSRRSLLKALTMARCSFLKIQTKFIKILTRSLLQLSGSTCHLRAPSPVCTM